VDIDLYRPAAGARQPGYRASESLPVPAGEPPDQPAGQKPVDAGGDLLFESCYHIDLEPGP